MIVEPGEVAILRLQLDRDQINLFPRAAVINESDVVVATLASLAWLGLRASRRHTGWGVAVVLLPPFAATAYGARYWRSDRGPILAFMGTFTLAAVLGGWLFTAWGGSDFVRGVYQLEQVRHESHTGQADTLRNATHTVASEQPTIIKASDSVTSSAAMQTRPAVRKVTPSNTKKRPERLEFVPIDISDARKYVGATVKVTRKNVAEKEYRLTGASPKHIELAQRNRHGSFSFHYRNSEVEKIRVLMNLAAN